MDKVDKVNDLEMVEILKLVAKTRAVMALVEKRLKKKEQAIKAKAKKRSGKMARAIKSKVETRKL